jgi:hypothetical protein
MLTIETPAPYLGLATVSEPIRFIGESIIYPARTPFGPAHEICFAHLKLSSDGWSCNQGTETLVY